MTDVIQLDALDQPLGLTVASDAVSTAEQRSNPVVIPPSRFDYGQYDPQLGAELQAIADNIRASNREAQAAIIDIGATLTRVKEKVGHGNWGAWLEAEFEMSVSTAERYMRVAARFGSKIVTVTNLEARTLYLMSAKSTPAPVVDQMSRIWKLASRCRTRQSGARSSRRRTQLR